MLLLLLNYRGKETEKLRACLRIPVDRKSALKIQFATSKTTPKGG